MLTNARTLVLALFLAVNVICTSDALANDPPTLGIVITIPLKKPSPDTPPEVDIFGYAKWEVELARLANGPVSGIAQLNASLRLEDIALHSDPFDAGARLGVQWTPRILGLPITMSAFIGCSLADPHLSCSGEFGPVGISSSANAAFKLSYNFASSSPSSDGLPVTFDQIHYTVSVVPEPESYALMLAGLSLIGLTKGTRRKLSHAEAMDSPAGSERTEDRNAGSIPA